MVTDGIGNSTEGGNRASLGHAGSQVTRQESSLIGLEHQPERIGYFGGRTAVLAFNSTWPAIREGVIDNGELEVRVGLGSNGGIDTQVEADGDEHIHFLAQHLLDVLGIVRLHVGFQELAVHGQLADRHP